jgi:peptide chain release factor 1
MAANDNLDLILRRHQEIVARLTEGAAGVEFSSLSRELADLEPVVAAIQAFRAKEKERDDLKTMLKDPGLDVEMRAMASAELTAAEPKPRTWRERSACRSCPRTQPMRAARSSR